MASSESRPSTCGAGSEGSTEGNEVEPQRQAAWTWKRREEALEGARGKTGNGVLIEYMYRKDVNSLWEVFCALEGRPNGEEELQKIRQGVATRVETRHNIGAMEECLPWEEVWWQKYIQRMRQVVRMGGPPEVEACTTEGGYKVAVYRETKAWKDTENWWSINIGILWTTERAYVFLWGVRGPRSDAAEVAAAVQRMPDNAKDGQV